MKMTCTKSAKETVYAVELSRLEALRLSRLMTLIDPDNVALQLSLNLDPGTEITGEMTRAEVESMVETMQNMAQQTMQEYAHMMSLMGQLKTLCNM